VNFRLVTNDHDDRGEQPMKSNRRTADLLGRLQLPMEMP
jgi:hypothetical protein